MSGSSDPELLRRSGSSDPELLRRLIEFELALERDSSEVVEEFDWGRLIHNPGTPAMWSGNYLEVRSTDLDARGLVALADRIQGPLERIEHRDVVAADPAYAQRLAQGFEALEGGMSRAASTWSSPESRTGRSAPPARSDGRASRRCA